jgi:hypothetical protein
VRSSSLRRQVGRWLDRGGRFYVYLILTVIVVSYVAVPWVADFVTKLQGYNPTYYEPKDQAREELQKTQSPIQLKGGQLSWQGTMKLLLLGLVVTLWLVSIPSLWGQSRPRSTRR